MEFMKKKKMNDEKECSECGSGSMYEDEEGTIYEIHVVARRFSNV
jgi:hypothetical protein